MPQRIFFAIFDSQVAVIKALPASCRQSEALIYSLELKSAMDFPLLQPCLALQILIVAFPLAEGESKKMRKNTCNLVAFRQNDCMDVRIAAFCQ
jgi:hypothetical protein